MTKDTWRRKGLFHLRALSPLPRESGQELEAGIDAEAIDEYYFYASLPMSSSYSFSIVLRAMS